MKHLSLLLVLAALFVSAPTASAYNPTDDNQHSLSVPMMLNSTETNIPIPFALVSSDVDQAPHYGPLYITEIQAAQGLDIESTLIRVKKSGVYFVSHTIQLGTVRDHYVGYDAWLDVNGLEVPFSRISWTGLPTVHRWVPLVLQRILVLDAGDEISFMGNSHTEERYLGVDKHSISIYYITY